MPPINQPKVPKAIIHFVGGFVLGSSIPIAYASILTELGNNGFIIIATSIPTVDNNHGNVAANALRKFNKIYYGTIKQLVGFPFDQVPVMGLSHSLGGKLTVLMGSMIQERKLTPKRFANIFLAFNNFGFSDNLNLAASKIPSFMPPEYRRQTQQVMDELRNLNNLNISDLSSQLTQALQTNILDDLFSPEQSSYMSSSFSSLVDQVKGSIASKILQAAPPPPPLATEFDPSPEETWRLLLSGYNIPRNLLIRFSQDELDLDQSFSLARWLEKRGCQVTLTTQPGDHLTPCAPTDLLDLVGAQGASGLVEDDQFLELFERLDLQTLEPSEPLKATARAFQRLLLRSLTDLAIQAWDGGASGLYGRRREFDLPASSRSRGELGWDDDEK